jgi:dTDP-4-dehydrorhamnose reductase
MRALIYGANGFLGKEFIRINNCDYRNIINEVYIGHADITYPLGIDNEIEKYRPNIILNFSGRISYDINHGGAIFSNNLVGPLHLLNCTMINNMNIPIISIGSIAALERDKNIYALSKYCLELLCKQYKNLFVVRLPSIFSHTRKSGAIYNFYQKCLTNEEIIIDTDLQYWNCLECSTAVQAIAWNILNIINNVNNEQVINVGYKELHNLESIALLIKKYTGSKSSIIIKNDTKKYSMVLSQEENQDKSCSYTPINKTMEEDIKRYVEYLCHR